jgi:cupin fold WbuC family metalloprotein
MMLRTLSQQDLSELSVIAQNSPRHRKNLNIHTSLEAPVQRLFNAMEPETYVRPHRHDRENGWELMLCMRGRFAILLFDDVARVIARIELSDQGSLAVEIPPKTWHSVVSLDPGTVMFEVKEGPYTPVDDKDFATWAPCEAASSAKAFLEWLRMAQVGDQAPTTA